MPELPESAADIPAEIKAQKSNLAKYGVDIDNNFEPLYIVPKEKKKLVTELKTALKGADELILATDEDREGESIGWHLSELLKPKVPVKRMVFSEITKEAIKEAIKQTRDLDTNLVAAQETRRVIDRLYGYRLSPLLWKKVAPGLSAGRVQSVAVRILVQRELERLAFRSGTYWDLKSTLGTKSGATFDAWLSSIDGKRVASGKDFDEHTGRLKADVEAVLLDEATARNLEARLKTQPWKIAAVETRMQTRKPYAPFTTSTMQQESNRKLNMSARETMQTAQRLYEDGLIAARSKRSLCVFGQMTPDSASSAIAARTRVCSYLPNVNGLSANVPRMYRLCNVRSPRKPSFRSVYTAEAPLLYQR